MKRKKVIVIMSLLLLTTFVTYLQLSDKEGQRGLQGGPNNFICPDGTETDDLSTCKRLNLN